LFEQACPHTQIVQGDGSLSAQIQPSSRPQLPSMLDRGPLAIRSPGDVRIRESRGRASTASDASSTTARPARSPRAVRKMVLGGKYSKPRRPAGRPARQCRGRCRTVRAIDPSRRRGRDHAPRRQSRLSTSRRQPVTPPTQPAEWGKQDATETARPAVAIGKKQHVPRGGGGGGGGGGLARSGVAW